MLVLTGCSPLSPASARVGREAERAEALQSLRRIQRPGLVRVYGRGQLVHQPTAERELSRAGHQTDDAGPDAERRRRRRHGLDGAQPDAGALTRRIRHHFGNPLELHGLAAVIGRNQQVVPGLQVGCGALQVEPVGVVRKRNGVSFLQPRPDRIPFHVRVDLLDGLEGLRLLARSRNALQLGADVDGDRRCRLRRRSGGCFQGERQVDGRCDSRPGFVADQARKLEQRATLTSRAHVGFVCDALLVESQHVGNRRPRVRQTDAEVVLLASLQSARRLTTAEDALLELRLGADAISYGAQPGPVGHSRGRLHRRTFAAPAVAGVGVQIGVGPAHLPPSKLRRSTPRSGKFGSLSRRAISRRPSSSRPLSNASRFGRSWRWNVVTSADATPSTPWAAAYSALK